MLVCLMLCHNLGYHFFSRSCYYNVCSSDFHHSDFQVTYPVFCLSSAIDSFYCIAHLCLFFSSSRSLVVISYIFSILFCFFVFLRSWTIFNITILNSVSGRLPISTSFSCFSGILSCPFFWDLTFCFFIVINFL